MVQIWLLNPPDPEKLVNLVQRIKVTCRLFTSFNGCSIPEFVHFLT